MSLTDRIDSTVALSHPSVAATAGECDVGSPALSGEPAAGEGAKSDALTSPDYLLIQAFLNSREPMAT